jgi:Acetyltransferase (GNAT) domain
MKRSVNKLKRTIDQWVTRTCHKRLFKPLFGISERLKVKAFPLSSYIPSRLRVKLGRFIGDLAFLIIDLPKKKIWQMTGSDMRIAFVGSKPSSLEVLPLLLDDKHASHEYAGKIRTFGLSKWVKKQLSQGCDLVICELSGLHWFRSPARYAFTVPQIVNQLLTYPEADDDPLPGTRFHDIRRRANRAKEAGYDWRFSRSREDFDFFYEHMYLPFVRSRHGELAQVTSRSVHWKVYIQGAGGGLVLITLGEENVAGAVCVVVDNVCYGVEMGYIDGGAELYKQGVNAFLFWAVAAWGRSQGAKYYDIGASLAWRSGNIFRWKARLGAKAIVNRYGNQVLAFSADRLPASLKARINEIGFVCEKDRRPYGLILDQERDVPLAESDLCKEARRAVKDGLSGVCVTGPGMQVKYYE